MFSKAASVCFVITYKSLPSTSEKNKFELCYPSSRSIKMRDHYLGTSISRSLSPRGSQVITRMADGLKRPKARDKRAFFTDASGRNSLGFSTVGGKDLPKVPMGIY